MKIQAIVLLALSYLTKLQVAKFVQIRENTQKGVDFSTHDFLMISAYLKFPTGITLIEVGGWNLGYDEGVLIRKVIIAMRGWISCRGKKALKPLYAHKKWQKEPVKMGYQKLLAF